MPPIRPCSPEDVDAISRIVNEAAEAYRGVIPADCWREPYMPRAELDHEIAAGVAFWGYEADGALVGVMGVQPAGGVELVRHAYVLPAAQGRGVGGTLLGHLQGLASSPMLVGTWAAADWAIRLYERHGFRLADPARKNSLLRRYWTVSDRQIEVSVVLTGPSFEVGAG